MTICTKVIPLRMQAIYFKKVERRLKEELGRNEAKEVISKAVFLFSIGNNDYLSPFLTSPIFFNSFSPSHYVSMVIGNFTSVIRVISYPPIQSSIVTASELT